MDELTELKELLEKVDRLEIQLNHDRRQIECHINMEKGKGNTGVVDALCISHRLFGIESSIHDVWLKLKEITAGMEG